MWMDELVTNAIAVSRNDLLKAMRSEGIYLTFL